MSNSSNGNDIKRSMTAGGEASMASMASRETRRQKIFSNSSRLYLMVIPTAFICVLSAWSRLASVVAQSTTQVQKSPGQVKTRSKREDKRIRNATLQPPQKYISCAYDIPSTYNWTNEQFTSVHRPLNFTSDEDGTEWMSCRNMLSNLEGIPAWHFMGDSQMGRLFRQIRKDYPHKGNISSIKSHGPCKFLEYVKMEPRGQWEHPNFVRLQGPVAKGLEKPFCSDLSSFSNQLIQTTRDENNLLEFLVIEYASDVEQQTPATNTTQETYGVYLNRQQEELGIARNKSACVVNTGLHDQKLANRGNQSDTYYFENVKKYLEILDHVCGKIIWLSLTHVWNLPSYPQDNEVSVRWNMEVKSILSESYPEKSYFIDVYNFSRSSTHKDPIHFKDEYYSSIAVLLTSLM